MDISTAPDSIKIYDAAGGGYCVTVAKDLPCENEPSGVRRHRMEVFCKTKDRAREFERAVKVVGVVDGGFGGLVLDVGAVKCEAKGCSVWMRNDSYFSDERCNRLSGHGLCLCEKDATELATVDDETLQMATVAGGRGSFNERGF